MKKLTALLLILVLCLSLAACGSDANNANTNANANANANANSGNGNGSPSAPGNDTPASDDYEPFTIRIATSKADTNNQSVSAFELKEFLEAETNGKVTVEVYTNSSLLSEDSMLDGMRGHITDIGIQNTSVYNGFVPEVALFSLLGLFTDEENMAAAFEPEDGLFNYINGLIDSTLSLHTIGTIVDGGTDCIANRVRPITTVADVAGLNFRAPNDEVAMALKSMGATPMTLPSSDAYTALQSGVCDGVMVSSSSLINNKFNEILPYATNLPGCPLNYVSVMVAEDTWNAWPDSVKALLEQKCAEIYEETKADAVDADVREWATIGETCEVIHLTDEQLEAFLEVIRPAQLQILEDELSSESYNTIMGILEKYAF